MPRCGSYGQCGQDKGPLQFARHVRQEHLFSRDRCEDKKMPIEESVVIRPAEMQTVSLAIAGNSNLPQCWLQLGWVGVCFLRHALLDILTSCPCDMSCRRKLFRQQDGRHDAGRRGVANEVCACVYVCVCVCLCVCVCVCVCVCLLSFYSQQNDMPKVQMRCTYTYFLRIHP